MHKPSHSKQPGWISRLIFSPAVHTKLALLVMMMYSIDIYRRIIIKEIVLGQQKGWLVLRKDVKCYYSDGYLVS